MASATVSDETHPISQQATVLVVEDDVLTRLVISDELRFRGLMVVEAGSADEALTVLQSSAPVHLLFTDVQMPGRIDGLGLAGQARTLRPELKIIVTSGRAPNWPTRNLADDFVDKPYDLARVAERIVALLGREDA